MVNGKQKIESMRFAASSWMKAGDGRKWLKSLETLYLLYLISLVSLISLVHAPWGLVCRLRRGVLFSPALYNRSFSLFLQIDYSEILLELGTV
jgi:hypothetical protein